MNQIKRTLLIVLVATAACWAQAQERRYAIVEYMHIPEGKSRDAYVATEKLWQRLHQRAVDAGICQAWYLESVENGGRGDFVTIRVYNSLDKMRNPWPDSIQKDLFDSQESAIIKKTEETRDLIHRELWGFEASAATTPGGDPSSYVYVQFMKPKEGKGDEYYDAEMKTYSKIHQERVKTGEMKNWHFMSRLFPSGTDSQFDFVTINVFPKKDWDWNPKAVEAALGKEAAAKLADPGTVRTMVREELWRPILRAIPAQK
jgi:hypothetical protein